MRGVSFAACLTAIAVVAMLGGSAPAAADGRVPVPTLAKPKGEACVLPKDEMRRQHPDLLKAQRDQTMREGIRSGKFSIQDCVECHASPDPAVKDKVVHNVAQFCDECHAYVGAQLDCWTCHNPELDKKFDRLTWEQPESPEALKAMLAAELRKGANAQ
jgi:hypothetical protein